MMKHRTLTLAALGLLALGTTTASLTARALAQAADAQPPEAAAASAPRMAALGDADGAFVAADRFSEPDGEKMYRRVCASCHMADAKGAEGAGRFPALAENPKLAAGTYPLYVVLKGLNGMPPIGKMMSDQQVADVVNHIRTHFGNSYTDPVTAEDAKALR